MANGLRWGPDGWLYGRQGILGTSLIGPAGYVKERVAAYREAGVTILNVNPIGTDPTNDLEQLRGWL